MASTSATALGKWRIAERTQSSRAETFRQFILFAGAVGFTLAFALSGITRLSPTDAAVFVQDGLNGQLDAITYVRIAVYIALFVFGLLWGLNGLHELNLLQEWLKPEHFVVKRRILVHATSILIGILLGVLFALTPELHTLLQVFIFYTTVDLFLWKLRRDEIADLIKNSMQTLQRDLDGASDEDRMTANRTSVLLIFQQGADYLRDYYLVRNHYGRVGIQLVGVTILATAPLIWGALYPDRQIKDFSSDGLKMVGYLLFIWCISISEVTVYIWRQDLDARLANLGTKLYEVNAT
jgi:hypothetical protein